MKVALIIEQLDLSRGGAERSTFESAEKLASEGMNITIITGKTNFIPENRKFEIVDFDIKSGSRTRKLKKFIHQAEDYVKDKTFDIIHSITPIKSATIYQPRGGLIEEIHKRNLLRRKGIAKITKRIIGLNRRQKFIGNLELFLARETNCRFLAVSNYVKRQCIEHLNLDENRVKVIFNGIDFSRLNCDITQRKREQIRNNIGFSKDDVVGLFIANNFKLKGIELIIDAISYLRQKEPNKCDKLKILIAGNDKVRHWFNLAYKLKLNKNIIFAGPVRNVSLIYGISDFLVHPTWYDPCSRVVLEAIASKLPVITSKYNGASELLSEANCGYVIQNMSDASELAEYMVKMYSGEIRNQLSSNTQQIAPQIKIETHISKLIEFYHYCLELR